MIQPAATADGLFEPVMGRAPGSWPWALPHLYAVNAAPTPGEAGAGAAAGPSGAGPAGGIGPTGRFEVVGYWRGEFRVVHSGPCGTYEGARQEACDAFRQLPVRFRMDRGRPEEENAEVDVSGTWPRRWRFTRLQDLGVLAAYLHQCATEGGGGAEALRFKSLIHAAHPPTEQLLVYRDALEQGRILLAPHLAPQALAALDEGLRACRKWLR